MVFFMLQKDETRRTQELNGYQCNWYRRNIMKRQIIISQNNCRPKRVRHVFCLSCNKMFIIHIYVNNKNAKQKCYIFNLIMIISILSIQNSNIYTVVLRMQNTDCTNIECKIFYRQLIIRAISKKPFKSYWCIGCSKKYFYM